MLKRKHIPRAVLTGLVLALAALAIAQDAAPCSALNVGGVA